MTALPKIYASEKEIAEMLGVSTTWLRSNADALERQFSFPKKDIAIGKRHVPSILAWAADRNGRLNPKQERTTGDDDGF